MKILLKALCLFLFIFLFSSEKTLAATSWVDSSSLCYAYALDINRNWTCAAHEQAKNECLGEGTVSSEGYISSSMNAQIFGLVAEGSGMGKTLCTVEEKPEAKAFYGRSAIGITTNMIAGMYSAQPASGVEYIADIFQTTGFIEPAYAQGVGYSGLGPLIPLWKMFRNISYLVIVIVMMVVGVMIMFRMKLNPQTVISIQNALPNIVVALILITFSYAIAGFLIDLMYLSINVIVYVFTTMGLRLTPKEAVEYQAIYQNANLGTIMSFTMWNHNNVFSLPRAIMATGWDTIIQGFDQPSAHIGYLFQIVSNTILGAVTFVGGVVGTLLVFIALMFVALRIFFILLMSYIQVILHVILGPVYILFGAIPGRNGFSNWIRGLIGNLIVFPTLVGLMLIAQSINFYLLGKVDNVNPFPATEVGTIEGTGVDMWVAPFLSTGQPNASLVIALISFGFLMLTPSILSAAKNMFAPKPVLPISPGMIFSPITTTVQTGGGLVMQGHYAREMFSAVPILNKFGSNKK